jgi:hypothetical protein
MAANSIPDHQKLCALTKRSSHQQFYLDARELKSARKGSKAIFVGAQQGFLSTLGPLSALHIIKRNAIALCNN